MRPGTYWACSPYRGRMTKSGDDALKRAARRRMTETGETYTQARAATMKEWRARREGGSPAVSVPVFASGEVVREGDRPAGPRGPKADLVICDEVALFQEPTS